MRRKKVLIDFWLQFRYIGLAVMVSLVSVLAGWYACFIVMQDQLLPAFGLSIMEAVQEMVYKNLYTSIAILLPFVAILFLFFTHRLVGSIFRITKTLSEIEDGNIQKIEVRKDDDLSGIVEGINKIVIKLSAKDGD
ncbi:MAG: hypothetical protein V1833_04160 [Elusimicrobiota bacterium]